MLSLRMAKDKIGTCDSKPIKLQIADKKSASRICLLRITINKRYVKTGYYSEVLFSMDIPFESSHEEKVRRCIDCRKVNDPRLCDKDGIEPNPENICKILEWPKNVTGVRQML